MKRHFSLYVGLLLLGASGAQSLAGPNDLTTGEKSPHNPNLPSRTTRVQVAKQFGHLPLAFEPNQGQADQKTRFLTRSLDTALSVNAAEAIFTLPSQPNAPHKNAKARKASAIKPAAGTLRMQLVGADSKAPSLQEQPLPGHANYFLGHDSSQWHANIPTFGKVGFRGVYPGVDVVYYGNQNKLEYDFVVAPHADPKQIKLHFAGAKGVQVNRAGDLILRAQGRELTWRKPTVYQPTATGKQTVTAHYRLKTLPNGQKGVCFALGHYDTTRPLVIDPVLIYSTRLGNDAFSGASSIAIDSSGSAYVANVSPISNRESVIVVSKLTANATGLVYTTFLGPTQTPPAGIAVDSAGDAYIAGVGLPTFPTTPGAYKTQFSEGDDPAEVFVTKLNPTGTTMVYSTLVGSCWENSPVAIAIDSAGNAYLTGGAFSSFPTTPGAFQTVGKSEGAGITAFVTKLNPTGTALVYSTLLSGFNDLDLNGEFTPGVGDNGRSIAVDANGDAYVTGITNSSNFPTTPGAYQTKLPTNVLLQYTGFVTEVNPMGTALIYSTFFGGSNARANGIAIDSSGSAYVVGVAGQENSFPTTPGAFQTVRKTQNSTAFVTKFNPTGTALVYSTYLGGSSMEAAFSVAVDGNLNAYVTGQATSSDFPTTIGAFNRVKSSPTYNNAFVTKLNASGTALIYSTFLGGSAVDLSYVNANVGDSGRAIVVDGNGNAYVSGFTVSGDFPTTAGAIQPINGNTFATKLSTAPIFPDFNNDGNTDLLLQNLTTGAIASWFMQGATKVGGASFSAIPPTGFAVVGVGDFSGNGNNTLVLQSSVTNQIALWYTSGTNNATINGGSFVNVTPTSGWKVVGVGDFNGDGKSDLVFQNQTTNQIAIWFMSGSAFTGGLVLPFAPDTGWNLVGTGDFNGDGFTDLVLQNQTTGQIALWYMNGTTYIGGTVLSAVPGTGWNVVGVGDYNGDGSADLLFESSTSNQPVVWYLRNGVLIGGETLSSPIVTGWKIVGPR